MSTEWWQKDNGQIRREIEFTAHVSAGGTERSFTFVASSPPIYDNIADLFTRLSFESIRDTFREKTFIEVGHIIRGEITGNGGVRECLVFQTGRRVPFAVIRPSVFERRT